MPHASLHRFSGAAAMFLFAVSAPLALAQRPALTKSVDEPGRTPYFDVVENFTPCSPSSSCGVVFKAVPAGYRLVVTHVSVYIVSCSSTLAYLTSAAGLSRAIFLPTPVAVGNGSCVSSGPITYYGEPGETPRVYEVGNSTTGLHASLTGYLVTVD